MSKEELKEQEENQEQETVTQDTEATDKSTETTEEQVEEIEMSEEERLHAELQEAKDKYLRLYSEFDNYRKRSSKERLELIKTASEDLVQDLIPVLDDFERAAKTFEGEKTDKQAVIEGVNLISSKFSKVLTAKGLKKMEIGAGDEFDADTMEAITKIPAPEEKLKGKIVDVVEAGYYLHDKVVRFAKVVIGE